MSCDVAVAAFLMLASNSGGASIQAAPAVEVSPQVVLSAPLYRDIVKRAALLRGDVDAYRKTIGADPAPLPGFDAFTGRIGELSALD